MFNNEKTDLLHISLESINSKAAEPAEARMMRKTMYCDEDNRILSNNNEMKSIASDGIGTMQNQINE